METVPLTKESFLKYTGRNSDWSTVSPTYYSYICEEVFDTKTSRYVYGTLSDLALAKKDAKLFVAELKKIKEEMWQVALVEQKKNPKLTHILAIQGFSDES